MKRLWIYLTLGLSGFLVFVLIFAPASAIWLLISDDVHEGLPQLQVFSVDGTIWSGSSQLQYQGFPVSRLQWRLDPPSLIKGRADLDLTLSGDGHRIQGNGMVSNTRMEVKQLEGYLHADYINAVSEDYGLTFSGRMEIPGLTLTADRQWFTTAAGSVKWDGGRVVFQSSGDVQVFDLPPLKGNLYLQDRELRLDIHHEQAPVLNIMLAPTGWVKVDLKVRLFNLANFPWAEGLTPDDTVLLVEEKILRGSRQGSP